MYGRQTSTLDISQKTGKRLAGRILDSPSPYSYPQVLRAKCLCPSNIHVEAPTPKVWCLAFGNYLGLHEIMRVGPQNGVSVLTGGGHKLPSVRARIQQESCICK